MTCQVNMPESSNHDRKGDSLHGDAIRNNVGVNLQKRACRLELQAASFVGRSLDL